MVALCAPTSLQKVGDILLVTDADWLFDEVCASLCNGETRVNRITESRDLRAAVAAVQPELVILDSQVGSMGGIASCLDLRLEAGGGRMDHMRVLLLLDRDADRWVAREAKADGWLVKPIDPFRLRKAHRALVAGDSWFEGEPVPA